MPPQTAGAPPADPNQQPNQPPAVPPQSTMPGAQPMQPMQPGQPMQPQMTSMQQGMPQPGMQMPMQAPMQPGQMPMQPPQLNHAYGHDRMAVISLILGIVSLPAAILNLLTIPIPIVAIVLGIIGFKRNKGMAIAGIVFGAIGIILSVFIFSQGVKIMNGKTKTADPNLSGEVTGVKGDSLETACYTFTMPSVFTTSNITKNTDCNSVLITQESTEDVVITTGEAAVEPDDPDLDAYLQSVGEQSEAAIGSKGVVTDRTFIEIDGVRAYKLTGTQNYLKYKYFAMAIVIPKESYKADAGGEHSAFIIVADSASSENPLDTVIDTWKWK
jgi:hypothetical protein